MSHLPKPQWARRLWLVMAVLLAASLLPRDSRELQISLLRVLLHIPGSHTRAQGQPPGCCVYIVPNVEFTGRYAKECLARVDESPDRYLLARFAVGHLRGFPPAAAWRGDGLLSWAAVIIAGDLDWREDYTSTQPVVPSGEALERALGVVRAAQEASPDEGILWIAEAAVQFKAKQEDAALRALRQAADKPLWYRHTPGAFVRARELLQGEGFPRFDAWMKACGSFSLPPGWDTICKCTDGLDGVLAAAVREGNEAKAASVLMLWADLCRGHQWATSGTQRFPRPPDWLYQFSAALASRQGRNPPDRISDWQEWIKVEKDLMREYITGHVPAVKADQLLREDEPTPEMHARCRELGRRTNAVLEPALDSSMTGARALLLLALLLSGLAIEVPFLLVSVGPTMPLRSMLRAPFRLSDLPREGWFWVLLAMAGIASAALDFSATQAVCQPVGLRSSLAPPVHPLRDPLAICALLAVCLLLLRLVLLRFPAVPRLGFLVVPMAYLVAVTVTCHLRHETITALMFVGGG